MITKIFLVFFYLITGLHSSRPRTRRSQLPSYQVSYTTIMFGSRAPLSRSHAMRMDPQTGTASNPRQRTSVIAEIQNVPNVNNVPGAFHETGFPRFLQAESSISPIVEVDAIEIPVVLARPITMSMFDRFLNIILGNPRNPEDVENVVDMTQNDSAEEEIPIIRLYEQPQNRPIQANRLRLRFY